MSREILRTRSLRVWWRWWLGFHWDQGRWVGIGGTHTMRTLNLGCVHIQHCAFTPNQEGE